MNAPRQLFGHVFCTLALTFFVSMSASAQLSQLPAGRLMAWGDSSLGQTNFPSHATNIVAISARDQVSMALRSDGQVITWGAFAPFVPDLLGPVTAIAAGASHCVALRADGRVIAFGANDAGQTNVPLPGLSNVTAIASGSFHSLAVRNGAVFGWGALDFDKLAIPSAALSGVTAVGAGVDHSVALRSDGSLVLWGRNNMNQLAKPGDATGVKAIAVGANHTLALRSNGTVRAWGANNAGQLNLANSLSGVLAIGAGEDHSLAVLNNGRVIVWGNNSSFQTNVPPGATNIIAATGGMSHSVALRLDPIAITTPPQAQAVAVGATVTFSVAASGSQPIRYQWRKNTNAINGATNSLFQLFNVTTNDIAYYSVAVSNALGGVVSTNALLQVNVPASISEHPQSQTVGVGSPVTFRVVASGTAPLRYQWRKNGTNIALAISSQYTLQSAQLTNAGNYSVIVSNDFGIAPSQVAVLTVNTGPNIQQQPQNQTVVAGSSATFTVVAQNADGYQWRKNGVNIPNATNSFYAIANAQQSDAANYSVLVTNQFGSTPSANASLTVTAPPPSSTMVVGWGENLVWNGSQWIDVSPPANLGNVIAVAVGGAHSLALRADGTVIGWGDNSHGQAGAPADATNVMAIAAGRQHSVALRRDGKVVAWGRNNFNQTVVPAHANVMAITAGADHSLAVQSNGVVFGWGRSDDGRTTPPPNTGAARVVGAGADHSLVVRSNSTVRAWGGQNLFGENTPPANLSNVVALAAGNQHSFALRANGTVAAWGNGAFGQTNVPAFGSPATAIASGANHGIALLQNGTVRAWGNPNNGQTDVPDMTGFFAIAAGGDRNLAVRQRQLRLQPPERLLSGRYRLTLSNEDGVPVTSEQMNRVQVFASTNLVSSLASWVQLTNAMSIFQGSIRLEDTQTNFPRRFYQSRENQ